jgi:hypothetical protein
MNREFLVYRDARMRSPVGCEIRNPSPRDFTWLTHAAKNQKRGTWQLPASRN